MNIERLDIHRLKADPKNARKHGPANVEAVKRSLAKFGQQHPVIIDAQNVIVAGHARVEAAKALGWKQIDCVRSQLKGKRRAAFAIADNRTSELAEWDDEQLAETLQALGDELELADLGFDEDDLRALLDVEDSDDDDQGDEDDDTQNTPTPREAKRESASRETGESDGGDSAGPSESQDGSVFAEHPLHTDSPKSNQRTFAVPILLDRGQYEAWQKRKTALNERNDTRAFLLVASL